jgi:iron complex outermembrane receptor protein
VKLNKIAQCIALMGMTGLAFAQTSPEAQAPASNAQNLGRVEITGSSIKRLAGEGALPVQVITHDDLQKQGVSSAEQLISLLSMNGNGLDNLASNADVVAGAQRGNNGSSGANLRSQGSGSTLVLLNGRRVAASGLNGGVVDLTVIPFSAIDRVEILTAGGSAVYGADAVGGVINFILRKDYKGLEVEAFEDATQHKGGNIGRVSVTGGMGDLDADKYNVMFSFTHQDNQQLRGDQRDFVNTFQPTRGLSVDTRGTPIATVFAISSLYNGLSRDNINSTGRGTGPTLPGSGSTQTYNGINPLAMPGQPGCSSVDGMAPYDAVLWASPAAAYGCAWDTGRAAVLQQPVDTNNFVARGTFRLGEHQLVAEYFASRVDSAKSFSANQITSSTSSSSPFFNLAYPSTGSSYNDVFNALVKQFPQLEANRGQPLAFRWRCIPCGSRELDTKADDQRLALTADGPVGGGWDYKVGFSSAFDDRSSLLGNGYFYGKPFAALINSGVLNPFSLTQTQAALDGLKAVSANGVTLYGGRAEVTQTDGNLSGPLFKMGGGDAMGSVGAEIRKESYKFNGNATDLATQAAIFNAPFDSVNTLDTVNRDIRAIYAEILLPITKSWETNFAVRHDSYSGFGGSTNPMVSMKFKPSEEFMIRGNYSTTFHVPSFNQLFNGVTESPYSGKDLVDPAKCPTGKVDATNPNCAAVTPTILTGGKADLGPEKGKVSGLGFVYTPSKNFGLDLEYWSIRRTNTIQLVALSDLVNNYGLFTGNFIRDASGNLLSIDDRWVNAGATVTRGIDVIANANGNIWDGKWTLNLNGTYLLEKKSKLIESQNWGQSEIAQFTRASDLGLRWKHSLIGSYTTGPWTTTLQQIYRSGYKDAQLPGVANGSIVPSNYNPNVDAYTIYNLSVSYTGFKNLTLTGGIKNLFDRIPPFSAAYDSNTGAGSDWEPRVADPRLRSVTFLVNYKFF